MMKITVPDNHADWMGDLFKAQRRKIGGLLGSANTTRTTKCVQIKFSHLWSLLELIVQSNVGSAGLVQNEVNNVIDTLLKLDNDIVPVGVIKFINRTCFTLAPIDVEILAHPLQEYVLTNQKVFDQPDTKPLALHYAKSTVPPVEEEYSKRV